MYKFYIRFAVLSLAILMAALLLIHKQPYNNQDLQELLLQEGCPMPCFMGIQPGVTTRREVIALLKANSQIESTSSQWDENSSAPMVLLWNQAKPRLIGGVTQVNITFQNTTPRKVAQLTLRLQNKITVSDFYFVFGQPSRYLASINSTFVGSRRYRMRIIYLYDQYNMSFMTISDCPIHLANLLPQPIEEIEYDAQMRTDGTKPMRSFQTKTLCL